jgi:hypothetical protein
MKNRSQRHSPEQIAKLRTTMRLQVLVLSSDIGHPAHEVGKDRLGVTLLSSIWPLEC